MHRRLLLDSLDRYEAAWPAEAEVVRQVRALVTEHEDCFERTCRPGHITGSAWVVSVKTGGCLLVHHRKLDRWIQPGGHADGDPDTAAVALREAREETGLQGLSLAELTLPVDGPMDGAVAPLDIDIHVIPERRDRDGNLIEDEHEHHDIRYLVLTGAEEPPQVSEESLDVVWVRADEVPRYADEESVLRLARKAGAWLAKSTC